MAPTETESPVAILDIHCFLDLATPRSWALFQALPAAVEGMNCHVCYWPLVQPELLSNPWGEADEATHALLQVAHIAMESSQEAALNRFTMQTVLFHLFGRTVEEGEPEIPKPDTAQLLTQLVAQHRHAFSQEKASEMLLSNHQKSVTAGASQWPALVVQGCVFTGVNAAADMSTHLSQSAD